MTDDVNKSVKTQASQKNHTRQTKKNRFSPALIAASVALTLSASALFGYVIHTQRTQRLTKQLNQATAKVDTLLLTTNQQSQAFKQLTSQVAALATQPSAQYWAISELIRITYLVELANDKLVFEHQLSTAVSLLKRAHNRAITAAKRTTTNNFNAVAEAIQKPLIALQRIDATAPQLAVLQQLDKLSDQIDQLIKQSGLKARMVFERKKRLAQRHAAQATAHQDRPSDSTPSPAPDQPSQSKSSWHTLLAEGKAFLKQAFLIRHEKAASRSYLIPDDKRLLRTGIDTQLAIARWAFIQRNDPLYHDALTRIKKSILPYQSAFLPTRLKVVTDSLAKLDKRVLSPSLPRLNDLLGFLHRQENTRLQEAMKTRHEERGPTHRPDQPTRANSPQTSANKKQPKSSPAAKSTWDNATPTHFSM